MRKYTRRGFNWICSVCDQKFGVSFLTKVSRLKTKEPSKYDLKLNYAVGDESLYMRLYIFKWMVIIFDFDGNKT